MSPSLPSQGSGIRCNLLWWSLCRQPKQVLKGAQSRQGNGSHNTDFLPLSCPQASTGSSSHWVTFPALHPRMLKTQNTQKDSMPTANSTTQRGPLIPQHENRSCERRGDEGVGEGKEGTEAGTERYTQRGRDVQIQRRERQTSSES